MKRKLYKDQRNRWLTRALFIEVQELGPDYDLEIKPIFSFEGREGYVDFHRTFVELRDPTGYDWALKYLGSWEHFTKLTGCSWFREELDKAVTEIKTIWKRDAIQKIREIAKSDDSKMALGAARYVAEEGWEKKGRGRPSKHEIDQAKRDAVKSSEELQNDMARILQVPNVRLVVKK